MAKSWKATSSSRSSPPKRGAHIFTLSVKTTKGIRMCSAGGLQCQGSEQVSGTFSDGSVL